MGQRASKLSAQDEQRLARKCNARRTALAGCRLANPDNAAACERLETALAMCYGAELPAAAAAAAEHERCFTALMNTGHYNGRRDCAAELAALKAGVKKAGAAL